MKSFLASIAIFGALIGIIIWNSLYVHRVCNTFTTTAEALPPCADGYEAVTSLIRKWEHESTYLELSVSHHSIDKISDCLYEWESAVQVGDEVEYERCRHLFLSTIYQIQRVERVTISNWV